MLKKIIQKYKSMSAPLKSGVWFTLCGFLQKAISMICTPIFTRILTEEQYGRASTFVAWQVVIDLLVTLTLYRSIMNLYVKYDNKKQVLSTVCSLSMVITVLWTIVAFVFINPLCKFVGLSKPLVICLFLYSIGEALIQCWLTYKRYVYAYKQAIFVSLVITIMSGFGGVFCIIFVEASAEWKIYPQVFAYLIIGLVIYLLLLFKERKFFDKNIWLFSLSFCIGLMPHYLSEFILQSSDKIMIDKMCGASDVAYYSVAYSVGSLILLFANALNASFAPYQYQKIKDRQFHTLAKTTNFVMLLLAGVLLMIMLFGYEIVYFFGGQKYLECVQAIVPICLGVYFNYMFQLFARVQEYYNKKITIVIPSIMCAFLNIILNYIFIRKCGYIAASYTTFICFAVFCLIHYIFYRWTCMKQNEGKLIYEGKFLLILSCMTSVLGFIILFVQYIPLLKYGLVALIILIVFTKRKQVMSCASQLYKK